MKYFPNHGVRVVLDRPNTVITDSISLRSRNVLFSSDLSSVGMHHVII